MATDANNDQAVNAGNEGKVTFDERQQARLDELIKEAQGRASRDVRSELDSTKKQLSELLSQNEALKAETSKAKTSTSGATQTDEVKSLLEEARRASNEAKAEANRLKELAVAKEKEAADARSETLNIRKQIAIQNAATKNRFINLDDVVKLTQENIKWDDSRTRFTVFGDNGTERFNSAIEPMSLDEFYAEYASKHPYLVHGDAKTGAGSSESQRAGLSRSGKYTVEQIFGKTSDGSLANALKRTDPVEYARLKIVARENKLII
jgi:hypothetical protein